MTENKKNYRSLALEAIGAMKKSYSPYSGFTVGAALLTKEGKIYTGANIENAAYSVTCCAERTALFSAILDGKRDFSAIAIAGGPDGKLESECAPCGVCRQALSEFCGPSFEVVLALPNGKYKVRTLGELIPESFGPAMLGR